MRLLKTVYVTGHRTKLGIQKGALMVRDPDKGSQRVPLKAIEGIVLTGNAQISTQALAACTAKSIRVAAIGRNGRLRFSVGGPVGGNVHLRVAQVRAADDPVHCSALARAFVAGKLRNSRSVLQRWGWDARDQSRWTLQQAVEYLGTRLRGLETSTDLNRIRGIEGDAARRYFQGIRAAIWGRGQVFSIRTRRPPRDPVNALLSFAYGLLLAEVVGALDSVGLDPQIGFLHGIRPGRPSLALDLMEEFRPSLADRFVISAVRRSQFRDTDFTATPGGGVYLSDDGRAKFLKMHEERRDEEVDHKVLGRSLPIASLPVVQSTILARHLRGDIPEYLPYVMAR